MQNEIIDNENNLNQVSSNFAFDELEKLRKKLLDLTSRNPLISFKHRLNSIRIIDEIPDQVFTELTLGKRFEISAIPEPSKEELIEAGLYEVNPENNEIIIKEPNEKTWAKHLGFDVSYDLPEYDSDIAQTKHEDTKLQSLKYFPKLDTILKKIKSASNTALQENGSNILYLTIGFLEWFESSDSEDKK